MTDTMSLHIEGSDLDKSTGYNATYLIDTLQCAQKVVEGTYLVLIGKDTMTKNDKQQIKLLVKNIEEGSFISDLQIHIPEIMLLFGAQETLLTPEKIWELVKHAFKYLKLILTARKKGEPMSISNDGDGNINVVNNGNGTVNIFPPMTDRVADKIVPNFVKMSQIPRQDGTVSKITLGEENSNEEMIFDEKTKELFSNKTVTIPGEIEISGKLTAVDLEKVNGKIDVLDSEIVPDKRYEFTFMDVDDDNIIKLQTCLNKEVKLVANKRVQINPFTQEEKIISFKVYTMNLAL